LERHWNSRFCQQFVDQTIVDRQLKPLLSIFGLFYDVQCRSEWAQALLNLPEPEVLDDSESMIVHIRGGDYKGNAVHDVNLQKFTKMAMSISAKRKRLLAFTNDKEFANSQLDELGLLGLTTFLPDDCNEVQLLVNVAASSAPLICANSTFSWWAGALSRSPRLVVLPRKWYATSGNHEPEGPLFRLPGAVVL
jgi:hypothetical protein